MTNHQLKYQNKVTTLNLQSNSLLQGFSFALLFVCDRSEGHIRIQWILMWPSLLSMHWRSHQQLVSLGPVGNYSWNFSDNRHRLVRRSQSQYRYRRNLAGSLSLSIGIELQVSVSVSVSKKLDNRSQSQYRYRKNWTVSLSLSISIEKIWHQVSVSVSIQKFWYRLGLV